MNVDTDNTTIDWTAFNSDANVEPEFEDDGSDERSAPMLTTAHMRECTDAYCRKLHRKRKITPEELAWLKEHTQGWYNQHIEALNTGYRWINRRTKKEVYFHVQDPSWPDGTFAPERPRSPRVLRCRDAEY